MSLVSVPPVAVLDQLRTIVGPGGYYDTTTDIEPFLTDQRRLYRGVTSLVLRPSSTAEVSQILKACNDHKVGVVPAGGNTGYCGGATPSSDGSQIVISLARLKRIRHIDAANYTLTAEAGCVLAEVQHLAAAQERLFPLSLGSEGSCQIGGNLSTNAGGTSVLRYGMMRDLVLGLEVVLADGRVLNDLSGLRKNNTGYDLRNLFIGAEGTLGIITAATLKLYPLPRTRVTALIAVSSPDAAVALLSMMREASSDSIATFELMPRSGLELVFKHVQYTTDPFEQGYPWYVLLEATSANLSTQLRDDITAALTTAQERELLLDAVLAQSETQRDMLWRIRETIPEAQRHAGGSIKHDVSVPISDIPRFIIEGSALCQKIAPEGVMVTYGHLGDGSLHFNINPPANCNDLQRAAFMGKAPQLNRAVHDLTLKYHGSISAEHGIGQLKRDELAHYKDAVAIDLMHRIKHTLDSNGIMNPGKILQT